MRYIRRSDHIKWAAICLILAAVFAFHFLVCIRAVARIVTEPVELDFRGSMTDGLKDVERCIAYTGVVHAEVSFRGSGDSHYTAEGLSEEYIRTVYGITVTGSSRSLYASDQWRRELSEEALGREEARLLEGRLASDGEEQPIGVRLYSIAEDALFDKAVIQYAGCCYTADSSFLQNADTVRICLSGIDLNGDVIAAIDKMGLTPADESVLQELRNSLQVKFLSMRYDAALILCLIILGILLRKEGMRLLNMPEAPAC